MSVEVVSFSFGLQNTPGLRIFCQSIAKHMPEAKLVLLGTDHHPLAQSIPAQPGPGNFTLGRWYAFADYYSKLDKDVLVLQIDARDLVLNKNPLPKLMEWLGQHDLVLFSEHQLTNQHQWCLGQALLYKKAFRRIPVRDRLEINGGCIFGRAGAMASLASYMASKALEASKVDKLTDQPILTNWYHAQDRERVMVSQDKLLYCHGELVKQRRWPLELNPLECAIYHQYDRTGHRRYYENMYLRGKVPDGVELVVSRYKEDLRWIGENFPGFRATIYDKGPAPVSGAIILPNVGFEAHTWLHHFHDRYDTLSPVTVCLQGNPWDHFKSHGDKLVQGIWDLDASWQGFSSISGHGSVQFSDGNPHHPSIGHDTQRLWRDLLGMAPPPSWHCAYGGMFAVSADRVRKHPREFYAKARAAIQSKGEACVAERFWWKLFE